MTALLVAEGVSRSYAVPRTRLFQRAERRTVLHPTDLSIGDGESLGIIGESGSGKSTLIRLLLGLDRPTSGRVIVEEREVDADAPARSLHWLRRQTGIVFQDPYASLDPRMTAGQIIAEPLWALDIPGDHRARVREVLEHVGLEASMADRHPHEFSGVNANASRSRARSPIVRGFWSATSPSRRSMSRSVPRYSPSSNNCGRPRASPSFSCRTTSGWCRTSATRSPS